MANNERKEICKRLRRALAGVNSRCLDPDPTALPTIEEIQAINSLMICLAKAIGIKGLEPVHMPGVIHALDKRYPTLRLKSHIDRLVNKLCSIPPGPITRITKQMEEHAAQAQIDLPKEPCGESDGRMARVKKKVAEHAAQAEALRRVLNQICPPPPKPKSALKEEPAKNKAGSAEKDAFDYKEAYDVLLPFTSPEFRSIIEDECDPHHPDYYERIEAMKAALGYGAVQDIRHQHHVWKDSYGVTNFIIWWIFHLRGPEWERKLREHFHGNPPSLGEYKMERLRLMDIQRHGTARKRKKNGQSSS